MAVLEVQEARVQEEASSPGWQPQSVEHEQVKQHVSRLATRQMLHEALTSLAQVEQGLRALWEHGWEGIEQDPATCGATLEAGRRSTAEGYRRVMALAGLLSPRV